MRKWILCFLVFGIQICFGQVNRGFIPTPYQDTIPPEVFKMLKARCEISKANADKSSGKVKAFAKKLYEQRLEMVVETFNNDFFIVEGELYEYLNNILARILQSNPMVKIEAEVYPFRSTVPNAVSFGDGTIAFMLGLLERMENEDQVAFVLCHELAHLYADHSNKHIMKLASLNYDKELRKKVSEVQRSEYNQYSKLKSLARDMGISLGSHSRENEFEADSIGLVFFRNAKYSPKEAIRTIEILDSVDVERNTDILNLKKIFHTQEYPFKDSWLNYSKSATWHKPLRNEEDDTLRTHPDCKRRAAALNRQLSGVKLSAMVNKGGAFSIQRARVQFDLIDTEFHYKQYGKAMFRAIQLVTIYPDNVYLHAMIGQCMFQLYSYQKNHELGRVLTLPDPRFEENYDRFLTFIHNLRLGEMKALAYNYVISQREEFFEDEDFLYAVWQCSTLDVSKIDSDKVKDDYIRKYPNGRYLERMKK